MDTTTKRLACLIASSVILHAAGLAPLKVSLTPLRQPFSPLMTVDLQVRESQAVAPRVPSATASVEAPVPVATETYVPRAPAGEAAAASPETSDRIAAVPRAPPAQPVGPAVPVTNESAANAGEQKQGGVRLALTDEVTVQVQLLSYEGGQLPNDTISVQGENYVYFQSPSLKRAAQPLTDAKPQYPAEKPLYLHGAVKLQLLIDEDGNLENTAVVCSNPTFEKSALASIEHMRFTPAQSLSGPVKSYMVVEFGYGRGYPCAPVPDLTPSK